MKVIEMKKLNDIDASIRLAAIVNSSDDAIIGKDLRGIITSWNPAAEKIFGYTAQEAVGRSIEFLLPTDRLTEESVILKRISQGEQVSHFETVRLCKDGRSIDVSATISPIIDSSGKIIGASKIVRDITMQKKAQELLATNIELKLKNQEQIKHAAELAIINEEKAKLSAALITANEEKVKQVAELVIAKLKVVHNEKLQLSLKETIDIARQLVELRDPYTAGHEKHVGDLAKAIAEKMGFDLNIQEGLMIAGYLHDIGKIIVPVEILCKPGKITAEEYSLIRNHVQAGYDLLKDVTFPWAVSQPVLQHHERLDGSGYPNHLTANQISIEGRILTVADVVEAMASSRPYRSALGIDFALAEIERGRGSIYDEAVVDACLKLFHDDGYKLTSTIK